MKRGDTTKKECQVIHAKRRAFERYGIILNHDKYRAMVAAFQEQKNNKFIRKQSNRISVHDFRYEDNIYRIVYDKERKVIVTFLSIEESPDEFCAL